MATDRWLLRVNHPSKQVLAALAAGVTGSAATLLSLWPSNLPTIAVLSCLAILALCPALAFYEPLLAWLLHLPAVFCLAAEGALAADAGGSVVLLAGLHLAVLGFQSQWWLAIAVAGTTLAARSSISALPIDIFLMTCCVATGFVLARERNKHHREELLQRELRESLGCFLHDEVGAELSLTAMHLEVASSAEPVDRAVVKKAATSLRRAVDKTRQLIYVIDAPAEHLGKYQRPTTNLDELFAKVEARLSGQGFSISTSAPPVMPTLSPSTCFFLEDCLDEAIVNITKYAEPHSEVTLNVVKEAGGIEISLKNVIGLRPQPTLVPTVRGIDAMREQMSRIGGDVYIDTEAADSTWNLHLILPDHDN